jgi:hypothetical protein
MRHTEAGKWIRICAIVQCMGNNWLATTVLTTKLRKHLPDLRLFRASIAAEGMMIGASDISLILMATSCPFISGTR